MAGFKRGCRPRVPEQGREGERERDGPVCERETGLRERERERAQGARAGEGVQAGGDRARPYLIVPTD